MDFDVFDRLRNYVHVHQLSLFGFNGISHRVLGKLLIHYAKKFKNIISDFETDGEGFRNLLRYSRRFKKFRQLDIFKFSQNISKVHIEGPDSNLLDNIEVKSFDISTLVDFLQNSQFLPTSLREYLKDEKCKNYPGSVKCKCCDVCKHVKCNGTDYLENCKCITNKSSCNRCCTECSEKQKDCKELSFVCCTECKYCVYCRRKLGFECPHEGVRSAIKVLEDIRNLSAHNESEVVYINLDNGKFSSPDFPDCSTWKELWQLATDNIIEIAMYLRNSGELSIDELETIKSHLTDFGSMTKEEMLKTYFEIIIREYFNIFNKRISLILSIKFKVPIEIDESNLEIGGDTSMKMLQALRTFILKEVGTDIEVLFTESNPRISIIKQYEVETEIKITGKTVQATKNLTQYKDGYTKNSKDLKAKMKIQVKAACIENDIPLAGICVTKWKLSCLYITLSLSKVASWTSTEMTLLDKILNSVIKSLFNEVSIEIHVASKTDNMDKAKFEFSLNSESREQLRSIDLDFLKIEGTKIVEQTCLHESLSKVGSQFLEEEKRQEIKKERNEFSLEPGVQESGKIQEITNNSKREQRLGKEQHKKLLITITFVVIICCAIGGIWWFSKTDELFEMSNKLRNYYKETIGKENMESVGMPGCNKRFYIELAKLDGLNTEKDLFFYTEQINHKTETVNIANILNRKEEKIVIVRGNGGVGKTYMLETAVLHWAEGKIWKDAKFVFLLKFREMNLMQNNSTIKKFIMRKYDFLFDSQTNIDEVLHPVSSQTVFLIDGLNEYVDIENVFDRKEQCSDTSMANGIKYLLDPSCGFLPGKRLVISGRKKACSKLRQSFRKLSIQTFDVLGFSLHQVDEYIESYAKDISMAKKLKAVVRSSEQLSSLSRIPALLWSLCELYMSPGHAVGVTTTTEMYVWQLTLFLLKHNRLQNRSIDLHEPLSIYKQEKVRNIVHKLAVIANKMYLKTTILMDITEFKNSDLHVEDIEKSGIVSRVKTIEGEKIQFKHMLLQEFLIAIYYQQNRSNPDELFTNTHFSEVLPLYAGLQGASLLKSMSSKAVINFVHLLKMNHTRLFNSLNIVDYSISIYHSNFLEIVYEYQNNVTIPKFGYCTYGIVEQYYKTKSSKRINIFTDLILRQQSTYSRLHLMYFLKYYGKDYKDIGGLILRKHLDMNQVKILADQICHIKNIILKDVHTMNKDAFYVIVNKLINDCPINKKLSFLRIEIIDVVDEVGEMVLMNAYRFPFLFLDIYTMFRSRIRLLSKSVYGNKENSSNYVLKNLTVVSSKFTHGVCQDLLPAIFFLETVEISPFANVMFSDDSIQYCREKIIGKVQQLKEPRIKKVIIQNWKLEKVNNLWNWRKTEELDTTERILVVKDVEEVLLMHKIITINVFCCVVMAYILVSKYLFLFGSNRKYVYFIFCFVIVCLLLIYVCLSFVLHELSTLLNKVVPISFLWYDFFRFL